MRRTQLSGRVWIAALWAVLLTVIGVHAVGFAQADSTLRVGIGAIPRNADPNQDSFVMGQALYTLMYDTLVSIDFSSGAPAPLLAVEWEPSGPEEWTFRLREGALFHDGTPITAADVKFSIDRVIDPAENSVRRGRLGNIIGVEVVDDLTVRILTDGPGGNVPSRLIYVPIIPKHYLERVGSEGFVQAPIGSGPYKVVEWEIGNRVVLEAHSGYWRGVPPVARIEFRQLPSEFSRLASFEAGELDVVYGLPVEEITRLRNAGHNVFSSSVGGTWTLVLRQPVDGPTSDRRVRQAINYAIDAEAIVEQIMQGVGGPAYGQALGPDGYGFHPGIQGYPYDPDKAMALLREAGYPNGVDVKLTATQGRLPKDREIVEAIAAYLEAVGIRAEIELQESAVFTERYVDGRQNPLFPLGFYYAPPMDWDSFAFVFVSDNPRRLAANDEYDRLYRLQSEELDPDRRLAILHEAQELIHNEAWAVFLFRLEEVYGLGRRVEQLTFFPDYSMDIFNARLR